MAVATAIAAGIAVAGAVKGGIDSAKAQKRAAALAAQADEIAKAIKDCPGNWSGIIHTSSTAEAPRLAERLARRGLQDRVWVAPKGLSTEQMADAWHDRARKKPGSINIATSTEWCVTLAVAQSSACASWYWKIKQCIQSLKKKWL